MKRDFFFGKNIFVTGASGFLGSWIVDELVENKANVVVLLRDKIARSNLNLNGKINKVNVVHGELENKDLIERAINEHEIDMVFHIGAQTIVGTANRNPLSTFESNIRGSWNIFEACRRNENVKSIVVASSDKAYGDQENLPYDESFSLKGKHPYDVSKSCTDLIAQSYFHTYKLPIGITRCGNLYGGGDLNFNRLIPGTILSILKKQEPIIRSDGLFVRDYLYVDDAVDGYLKLAENVYNGKHHGEAFNLSINNQLKAIDVVNKIISKMSNNIKPRILNEAKSEIRYQYLSSKKAKENLNWEARTDIDSGLKKTIKWYKSFFKKL